MIEGAFALVLQSGLKPLHKMFTGSGSKLDQFNPHIVGELVVEEQLSRCQRVQSIKLKVECPESHPERYSGDVTCVAWKIQMT